MLENAQIDYRFIAEPEIGVFIQADVCQSEEGDALPQLTGKQTEVMRLIAQGLTYEEISRKLDIGIATIKTHSYEIYRRLDVQTGLEMTLKVLYMEMVEAADLVSSDFNPYVFRVLTPRQKDIVELLAKSGLTNKEIAYELSISDQTVKNSLKVIFKATGFSSRISLAVAYLEAQRRNGNGESGQIYPESEISEAIIFLG